MSSRAISTVNGSADVLRHLGHSVQVALRDTKPTSEWHNLQRVPIFFLSIRYCDSLLCRQLKNNCRWGCPCAGLTGRRPYLSQLSSSPPKKVQLLQWYLVHRAMTEQLFGVAGWKSASLSTQTKSEAYLAQWGCLLYLLTILGPKRHATSTPFRNIYSDIWEPIFKVF